MVDPLEAVIHSKGDSIDYTRTCNPKAIVGFM